MKDLILKLSKESLEILNKFSLFPMILYDRYQILFSNNKFDELLSYEEFKKIKEGMDLDLEKIEKCNCKKEIYIDDENKKRKWYQLMFQFVSFNGKESVLAYLVDITDKKHDESKIAKLSKLRALMLEVSQAISQQDDLEEIFALILKNCLKSMENATLGTIFIKQGNTLQVAYYIGFDKSIEKLRLPLDQSFLYRKTKGKLDKIIYIEDLTNFKGHYLVKTCLGHEVFIKSTISAPIYINGEFYGMINIDSIKTNAFEEEDIRAMEFLKPNIEIALTNHFLYQEKILLARFDPLTGIANRGYFEEQFFVILKGAIRYKEQFCFAVFDVDDLKKINDNNGHLVGDEAIKRVAKLLKENKRKSDLVARIGEDEFVAVYLHSEIKALSKKLELLAEKLKIILLRPKMVK